MPIEQRLLLWLLILFVPTILLVIHIWYLSVKLFRDMTTRISITVLILQVLWFVLFLFHEAIRLAYAPHIQPKF